MPVVDKSSWQEDMDFFCYVLATLLSKAAFHCALAGRVTASLMVFGTIYDFSPTEHFEMLVVD